MAGALDCYQRAVAQYKLAGHWKLAGETLGRMGDIYRKQADHAGAGRLYGEAGNCYRKCSATAAVASYHKVTQLGVWGDLFGGDFLKIMIMIYCHGCGAI